MKSLFIRTTLILSLSVAPALAQAADQQGFWGTGELSFLLTKGNSDTLTLGTSTELNYKPSVWSGQFKGSFFKTDSLGRQTANNLTLSLRGARALSEDFELFTQLSFARNPFADMELSSGLEAGAGYFLTRTAPHELKGELGFGYTNENRITAVDRKFASGRASLLYKWKLSETTDFSDTLDWLANFQTSSDWKLKNVAAVTTSMTSVLSLKLALTYEYANLPSPGFRRADTTMLAALVAKF